MGRKLRIFEPDAYYHLTSRGNNGEAIVRDDLDCFDFLRWLSRIVFEEKWRVISYCLMTNHYHLLVGPPNTGFAGGMQLLLAARRERRASARGDPLHRP